jgi:hypothetical protein
VTEQKNNSLAEARDKYRQLRSETYRDTVHELRRAFPEIYGQLRISEITKDALSEFKSWDIEKRYVNWDWPEQSKIVQGKRPSYWEMAIWNKSSLCGLVLGSPSRRRSRLYIEGIEGAPTSHALKGHVLTIALLAAERYADLIGCDEVWIVNPESALLASYLRAGYNPKLFSKFLARVFGTKTFATKNLRG